MKKLLILTSFLFLAACSSISPSTEPAPSASEQNMADAMGVTVEELRNQTPEEHMQMMMNINK